MCAPPPPQSPAIRIENITKTYETDSSAGVTVLRGVSLEVAHGEFVALMGASGSGKTTLLNLVGGLDTPDSGRIEVDGREIARMGDHRRSAFRLRRIGFVFQFFNLLPHLTVAENVALPLLFLRRPHGEAFAAAGRIAGEVGLADKLDRRMHQLSGGEMQRVALARALVHQPTVVLADEPTGNLDSQNGGLILRLMRELTKSHGAAVLMATHDAEAAAVADRIVHIRDGRIEKEKPA
jgi:putative ABC transport system ATP-binding protein